MEHLTWGKMSETAKGIISNIASQKTSLPSEPLESMSQYWRHEAILLARRSLKLDQRVKDLEAMQAQVRRLEPFEVDKFRAEGWDACREAYEAEVRRHGVSLYKHGGLPFSIFNPYTHTRLTMEPDKVEKQAPLEILDSRLIQKPAVLCYATSNQAYFTTQALSEQWGDDWNDAPFEHNAGRPYAYMADSDTDKEPWEIWVCYWAGPFRIPEGEFSRPGVTAEQINAGRVPWLWPDDDQAKFASIHAGVTYHEFRRLIEAQGGTVGVSKKYD